MAGDAVLFRDGPVSVPLSYVVPASGELLPLNVEATINGAAAASPFYAVLQVLDPNGRSMGKYRSEVIAAGGSADVTWFPGLGGSVSGSTQTLVGARIIASSTQSISTSSDTDLHYQTIDFDTDGMVNLGADSRILTVNSPGLYLVICESVWTYANAGRRINGIVHNNYVSVSHAYDVANGRMGVWSPVGGDGFGGPRTGCVSVAQFQANTGDFFSSGCFQASGSSLNINGQSDCFLSAVLMGD